MYSSGNVKVIFFTVLWQGRNVIDVFCYSPHITMVQVGYKECFDACRLFLIHIVDVLTLA